MVVIIGALCLFLVAVLYTALAFGAPLGFFALGGKYKKELPDKEKMQVKVSIVILLFAIYILLNTGNVFGTNPGLVSRIFAHIFMVYFVLNTVLNLLSKSIYEKVIMTPIALFVAFSYFYALYL